MFSPHEQQQQQQQQEEEEELADGPGFCSFCVELVGGTSNKQNWKGLGIAFIVIAFICFLIIAATRLTEPRKNTIENHLIPISEADLYHIQAPKSWNGTWISERYFSYLDRNNSIWIYDCDRLREELVFKPELLQDEFVEEGIISPSTRYILMPVRKETIRPYYTEYHYNLFEKTKLIGSIRSSDGQRLPVSAIVYSHSDQFFAFIHHFNIYIYDFRLRNHFPLTFDGSQDTIHNGLVEWIYEYEIFNRNQLLFWSPADTYLAFIKINLSNVPKNHYLKYEFLFGGDDKYSIPYPKYNETLPVLDVYIYNLQTKQLLRANDDEQSRKSFAYIHHFVWSSDKSFSIVYGNRRGTSLLIQFYEILNDRVIFKNSYTEETKRGFLLPRFFKPFFHPSGAFAYIIRFNQIKQKAYPQVVRIHLNQPYPQIDGKSSKEISANEIIHVDNLGQVYFTGSVRNNSLEMQLFRWNFTNTECLSCHLSCGYVHAQFSHGNGKYYILECLGPSIPYSFLFNQREQLALINTNQPFQNWTETRSMPYIDYFTVPLDNKNTVGHGMIILPPDYQPNRTIASYPILLLLNDRLADQRVNKKYFFSLAEFLQVVEDQIGIVLFDSHGSTGQDESYLKNNHPNWFERQFDDHVKLAQYLKSNESKFGGTLNETRFGLKAQGPAAVIALKLLEESEEYICAFLQSPVIDLTSYYAIYSERIPGLKTNPQSFHRFNLQNKSLAIAHGTADEIVHFKHSATLVKSLTHSNIEHEFKVYPDVQHSFRADPKIYHDFLSFQRQFFQKHLGGQVNKERTFVVPEEDYD